MIRKISLLVCVLLLSNGNVADVNKIKQFSAPLKSPHTFIGFLQELNGETGFFSVVALAQVYQFWTEKRYELYGNWQ